MIAELFDFIVSDAPFAGMLVPIILFCCGLFAGTKINPAFGLLILGGTYVVDFAISNSIVVSGGLDMDRFPMNIEAIAYGVIGLGWMISGTISAINRDNAAIDRAEEERL